MEIDYIFLEKDKKAKSKDNVEISDSDIIISFAEMTKKIMESINTLLKPINLNGISKALTSIVEQLELSKTKIPSGIFPQIVNPILAKPVIEIPKINDIFEKVVTPMPTFSIANELLLPASLANYGKQFQLPPSFDQIPKLASDIPHCIQPTFKKFKNTKKYAHHKD